jgi:hypothetical protein
MNDATNPIPGQITQRRNAVEAADAVRTDVSEPDLKDPRVVLSFLEADQVVAAKRQSRFGRRTLSPGARILLWGLRIYVLLMLIIIVISVLRTIHPAH